MAPRSAGECKKVLRHRHPAGNTWRLRTQGRHATNSAVLKQSLTISSPSLRRGKKLFRVWPQPAPIITPSADINCSRRGGHQTGSHGPTCPQDARRLNGQNSRDLLGHGFQTAAEFLEAIADCVGGLGRRRPGRIFTSSITESISNVMGAAADPNNERAKRPLLAARLGDFAHLRKKADGQEWPTGCPRRIWP